MQFLPKEQTEELVKLIRLLQKQVCSAEEDEPGQAPSSGTFRTRPDTALTNLLQEGDQATRQSPTLILLRCHGGKCHWCQREMLLGEGGGQDHAHLVNKREEPQI